MDNVIDLKDFIAANRDRIFKARKLPILANHDPNKRMVVPVGKGLADVIPIASLSLIMRQAISGNPGGKIIITCSEDLYDLSGTDLDAFIDKIFGGITADIFDSMIDVCLEDIE